MERNSTIKVLVADDHSLFRKGIIRLLKDQSNIFIIAEAENGEELITKYFEFFPDVILVDIAMPFMPGPVAVMKILEKDPKAKALFLSMYDGDEYIFMVLKSGGMGLINKNVMDGELAYAIEQVFRGEKYFRGKWTNESLEQIIRDFESYQNENLDFTIEITHREEQVLKFLNEGLNTKEMAEKLQLSRKTIDFYRANIMRKFKLKSMPDLIRFAIRYFYVKNDLQQPGT
ncbi:MAG: response regulator transcription factor [Bacteroidetes bacterium]|nr:response regulator transcription factor [Bacteroidota bacterium]